MIVHTLQMAKWRLASKHGFAVVDATVKTGDVKLAPTWDMVLAYKKGELTEDEYTALYTDILDQSLKDNPTGGKSSFAETS